MVESVVAEAEERRAEPSGLTQEHPLIGSGEDCAAFWQQHAAGGSPPEEPAPEKTLYSESKTALNIIVSEPASGKTLREELRDLRSFRVGRTRIIYKVVQKQIIEIVAIGPRKAVYEETYRLLKKAPPPER
jgi:mRNA-degrading endonuclease RelE of RelBE toxin-antitoxin system